MNRSIVALLLITALAGCKNHVPTKAPPVLAQCDAICYAPCVKPDGDTEVRWEGDPNQAASIDALGELVIPTLTEKLRVCDSRRNACVQCLNRLETQGVIIQ